MFMKCMDHGSRFFFKILKETFTETEKQTKYLSKCGSTSCANFVSSTEVQIMRVQYASGKTYTIAHHIILIKPARKPKCFENIRAPDIMDIIVLCTVK